MRGLVNSRFKTDTPDMRLIAMGFLITLLSAAGCSEKPGVLEEPPSKITKEPSRCDRASDMRVPGSVDWMNVEPDLLIEWDNARNEAIDVTYQDAKICDLIAIDFIFEGRKAPHNFPSSPGIPKRAYNQMELVSFLTQTYVKRQSDIEGFGAETRVRKFYVINSAEAAAIEVTTTDYRQPPSTVAFDKEDTVVAIIRIQPPAGP